MSDKREQEFGIFAAEKKGEKRADGAAMLAKALMALHGSPDTCDACNIDVAVNDGKPTVCAAMIALQRAAAETIIETCQYCSPGDHCAICDGIGYVNIGDQSDLWECDPCGWSMPKRYPKCDNCGAPKPAEATVRS
jgi:hypothetical protein